MIPCFRFTSGKNKGKDNYSQLSRFFDKNPNFMKLKKLNAPKEFKALKIGALCMSNGVTEEKIREYIFYLNGGENTNKKDLS